MTVLSCFCGECERMSELIMSPTGLPALTVSAWTEHPSCSLEMGPLRLWSRTDGPLLHRWTVLDYVRGGSSQQFMGRADH